jgi:hypothetical protein
MQLRNWSALALYVGSYVPLSLILLAQDLDEKVTRNGVCPLQSWGGSKCVLPLQHPWWSIGAVAFSLICLAITLWTLGQVRGQQRVRVSEAKHVPADLINYVIPYVLTFMGLDYGDSAKLLGFAVFFLWIFWITQRSGQIIMNPILVAFGWRLYEIKFKYLQSEDAFTGRVLSKMVIEPNAVYRHAQLQDVMIIHDEEQGG